MTEKMHYASENLVALDPSTFGGRLRIALEKADMKVEALCDALDYGYRQGYRWLSNDSMPRGRTLRQMAEVLGVNDSWLESGTGPIHAVQVPTQVDVMNSPDDRPDQGKQGADIRPVHAGEVLPVPLYKVTEFPRSGRLKRVKGASFPWHIQWAGGHREAAHLMTIVVESDEWGVFIRRLERGGLDPSALEPTPQARVTLWERFDPYETLAARWREGHLRDGLFLTTPHGKQGPVEPWYIYKEPHGLGVYLYREMKDFQRILVAPDEMEKIDLVGRYVNYYIGDVEVVRHALRPDSED